MSRFHRVLRTPIPGRFEAPGAVLDGPPWNAGLRPELDGIEHTSAWRDAPDTYGARVLPFFTGAPTA